MIRVAILLSALGLGIYELFLRKLFNNVSLRHQMLRFTTGQLIEAPNFIDTQGWRAATSRAPTTIRLNGCSVDVARGLVLLCGLGIDPSIMRMKTDAAFRYGSAPK